MKNQSDELNQQITNLKQQRNTAFDECKKLNQIIEENDKNIFGMSQKQNIDRVSHEQMGIVVANLADKNKQLDRDLNEQIIQN